MWWLILVYVILVGTTGWCKNWRWIWRSYGWRTCHWWKWRAGRRWGTNAGNWCCKFIDMIRSINGSNNAQSFMHIFKPCIMLRIIGDVLSLFWEVEWDIFLKVKLYEEKKYNFYCYVKTTGIDLCFDGRNAYSNFFF